MFTGIVEEAGYVLKIEKSAKSAIITIKADIVLEDAHIGDSIAVNGICLTVVDIGRDYFSADVMSETINRTSMNTLSKGAKVNLERAMRADGRFGGHIVSGHIDGTGSIKKVVKDDNAVWYTIGANEDILRYVVEKGSITIDGISLTVAYVDNEIFKVSVIPHTRQVTNLSDKSSGDIVNIECDIVGKYVEKLTGCQIDKRKSKITEEFLINNGF